MRTTIFLCALALGACQFGDNIVEAPDGGTGYSADVSACCDYFNPADQAESWLLHGRGLDEPQQCLQEHTEPGVCRWLDCLGGLKHYEYCAPPPEEP